jgi:hypothetical protein
MRFVKANPNEYLVVGRHGRVTNRGTAASAWLWPGSTCVLVPSTQQEAAFEMTQESKDSIPLRFKGIVIYHITDPVIAARQFNFADGSGVAQINTLITHVCLGELRATAAHLTMDECIEQRKTTLTNAVAEPLARTVPGWGIALDVVQVAQVFIVDQELRRQLEAEVRNTIRVKSELADLRAREGIQVAQAVSARRMQQEQLETEREKSGIAHEQLRLKKDYERAEVEAEHPLRLLKTAREMEALEKELERRALEARVEEVKVRTSLLTDRARQDMRKEVLPLEQVPTVAQALAGMFRGMNLSIYGQEANVLASLAPVIDLLARKVREGADVSGTSATARG